MPDQSDDPQQRFESIKQFNQYGVEYWSARDLMPLLGYNKWERFDGAIQRAMDICIIAKQDVSIHFPIVPKTVVLGYNALREITNYYLTRYALHLVLACSDIKKPEIAEAMAYITLASLDPNLDYRSVAESLGISISRDIKTTKEQRTISQIISAFKHLRTIQQYRVALYRIDLYFPDPRIAVECDEDGHRRYTQEEENHRQRHIEQALGCRFVRYNPDSADFDIGDVINQIILLIYGQQAMDTSTSIALPTMLFERKAQ